ASDNLVVRATLADGTVGFGEGVPRPYVTGETIESTFAALSSFDAARALGDPEGFDEAARRVAAMTLPSIEADPRGMDGNAARCALEMALLDAFGRRFGQGFGRAVVVAARSIGAPDGLVAWPPRPVRYSGAITAESGRKERIGAWKMRLYGFHQVKIKVGVAG